MVDDPIGGNSWGYIEGLRLAGADTLIGRLIDTVSKGGFYLLNISPMADGTIPQNQQEVLLKIGAWLETNGEAIYGTRPWVKFMESGTPSYHFTTKGDALYAICSKWPDGDVVITSLAADKVLGKVQRVAVLGRVGSLDFTQDAQGLKVRLPANRPGTSASSFKIAGLQGRIP